MHPKRNLFCLCFLLVAALVPVMSGCDAQQPYPHHHQQPGWNVDVNGAGWNVDINGQSPQRNPYFPNVRPAPVQPRQPIFQQPRQPILQPPQLCPGGRCPARSIDSVGEAEAVASTVAVKQGSCKCLRCMRPTVGADWHSLWTPAGDVATYLCNECWDRTTPEEHAGYLRLVLQRAKLPDEKREPFVAALKSTIATD
ncbi:hypothetical protein Poly24_54860 [Rosistilla carotiformis]|uniref:GATA-type domain-containing protein n=1 Tax=Rosistilla carotiformis TaxID=2528017 RepID=A0A518JNP8_9BACT|nr:hypothetical protein [Rosistilla carotiformis]QDV67174.1 hypothetical protein Poly24_08660 [Rosistilla carotiformis]QDV71746.1 hypothetical protein Poly24_54860 [Rosistilla carotiformis]